MLKSGLSFSKDNALMACRVQFICLHMATIHAAKHCMIHLQNRLSNQFHVDFTCKVFDMSFEMDLQVRGFAYLGLKFEPIQVRGFAYLGLKFEPIVRWPLRQIGLNLRPTLDQDPGSNFLWTNLDSCEANWILELECTWMPSLIFGSPNQELSPFSTVFWSEPIDFPSKTGAM
jgi:hypothetical protein